MKCYPKSATLLVKKRFLDENFGGVVDYVPQTKPEDLCSDKQLYKTKYLKHRTVAGWKALQR